MAIWRASAPSAPWWGPQVGLRLDVNGRWSLAQSVRALRLLASVAPEWVEQPLPAADLAGLAELRRMQLAPIGADESVHDATSLEAVLAAGAADVIVLKPMFLGGLLPALALHRQARAAGVRAILTHALESAIGRTGTAHLGAALEGPEEAHGLGRRLRRRLCPGPARDRLAPAGATAPRPWLPDGGGGMSVQLPQPLLSLAQARPTHPVLLTDTVQFSARSLCDAVAQRAGALAGRGVAAGMTVALAGPNDADWVVSLHALGWLGAAVLPLPSRASAAELAAALQVGQPAAAVYHGALPAALAAALPATQCHAAATLPTDVAPAPERFWPLEEVRLRLLTSGTTAAPRLVALSTAQLLFSSYGACIRLGHQVDDRWLLCLPLHHVGGLGILFRAAWQGTTVVLAPRFEAIQVAAQLDAGAISLVSLVPTMLQAVLAARPAQPFPSRLRALVLGGAAADAALLRQCRALALPLVVSWGMTETAAMVATEFPGASAYAPGLCGPPLPFARIEAPAGRLTIRGPVAGAEAVCSDDLGQLDPSGAVQVHGRQDDIIISGGENIVPQELEAVLQAHPSVAQVAVVGVPSPQWGQRPVAFVVPTAAAPLDAAALVAWCRGRLAAYKVPDRFIACAELPRNPLGKLLRAQLRAQAVAP